MIQSFRDRASEDIYNGADSRAARSVPRALWKIVVRKMDMLNAAHDLRDMRAPPGNRLEALEGTLKGFHSVRVNDQYRVVFQWVEGNAKDVFVTDYH